MNKNDVIRYVSKKTNFTKENAALAVDAVYECLYEALCNEEKIKMQGIGSFVPHERAARKGNNPKTREEIDIPAKKVYKFRLAKGISDKLNAN